MSMHAIYLIPPHGELIAEGKKSIILKAKKFSDYLDTPLYVASGDYVHAKIILRMPQEITLNESMSSVGQHKISLSEVRNWWPSASTFWEYPFEVVEVYQTPLRYKPVENIRDFVKNIEFIDMPPVNISESVQSDDDNIEELEQSLQEYSNEEISKSLQDGGITDYDADDILKETAALPIGGGKALTAKKLISMFPSHNKYVEPFCGGAATFFQQDNPGNAVINDANPNTARALSFIKSSDTEWQKLQNKDWKGSRERFSNLLKWKPLSLIDQVYRYLYLAYFSFRNNVENFRDTGTSPNWIQRWSSLRDKMKNTSVTNGDGLALIKKEDSPNTFFFIDPPYEASVFGDKYLKGDTFNWDGLVNILRSVKGKFLMTIDDNATQRARWKDFTLKTLAYRKPTNPAGSWIWAKHLLVLNYAMGTKATNDTTSKEAPPPEPNKKGAIVDGDEKKKITESAIAPHSTAMAPEDTAWDGNAVMKECTGAKQLRLVSAWVDEDDADDADQKSSYKLPHHTPDGKVVWKGVAAAGGAVMGARTALSIPEGDMAGVKAHLEKHYHQFSHMAPWERSNVSNDEDVKEGKVNMNGELAILSQSDGPLFVYGLIAVPNKPDSYGHTITSKEITDALHNMNDSKITVMHNSGAVDGVTVTQIFQAPTTFSVNGKSVPEGSAVVEMRIENDKIKQLVLDKTLQGFSLAGGAMIGPNKAITDLKINELSLVDRPAIKVNFVNVGESDWSENLHECGHYNEEGEYISSHIVLTDSLGEKYSIDHITTNDGTVVHGIVGLV